MAQHLIVAAIFTLLAFVVAALFALKARNRSGRAHRPKPPPGKLGWPLIGETLQFLGHQRSGKPYGFFDTRLETYGEIFKTSLVGHPTAVFCGPAGNRFVFTNENKVLVNSWPTSVRTLLGNCLLNAVGDDAKRLRRMLMTFLKPEALQKFVARIDSIAKNHLDKHWSGKQQVTAFPLIKEYTFSLACNLFASVEDECEQAGLFAHFNMLLKGVLQIPIDFPGTRYYKAKRAADAIRREIQKIIDSRIADRSAAAQQDLLSYLLCSVDERGISLTYDEVKDNILLLLFAGHDTTSSTLTVLLKYLAEQPDCYRQVRSGNHTYATQQIARTDYIYRERERGKQCRDSLSSHRKSMEVERKRTSQFLSKILPIYELLEIGRLKKAGQFLEWEDLQKMKYSWRVVQEALRLTPPAQGGFRQAITDFTYNGFTIPEGWKIYWTVNSTHRRSEYFSDAEKFDPSRFEGAGPAPYTFVPFGGGPRMCPGNEFARMEILVFLHNLVKKFDWDLVFPDEMVTIDPMPAPLQGLPIKLHPHG